MFVYVPKVHFLLSWSMPLLLFVICVLLCDAGNAQLSFHTDANTNSFTLKTPSLQQSFTRYYGGTKPAAEQQQQQQLQPDVTPTTSATSLNEQLTPGQVATFPVTSSTYPSVYLQQYPLASVSDFNLRTATNPAYFNNNYGYFANYPGQYQLPTVPASPQKHSNLRSVAGGLTTSASNFANGVGSLSNSKSKQATNQNIQLQQQLERLQQMQEQQQLQLQQTNFRQQQLQQLLNPNAPPPPSYADQMQAAYLAYQQQQRQYELQQQRLLQQLYETFPQVSDPWPAAVGSEQAQLQQPQTQTQRQVQKQPQQQRFNQHFNGGSLQQPFYTTEHHFGFMQQQQSNIMRDQQQRLYQNFTTNDPPKTIQLHGMAVPDISVLGALTFSPANQVSHVNFTSGNLSYTF